MPPKDGFETPKVIEVPATLRHEGNDVEFTNAKYSYPGRLMLKTSRDPLRGHLGTLNTIDFIGEVGVIASYRIHKLGASRFSGQVEFIYGESSAQFWKTPIRTAWKTTVRNSSGPTAAML